MGKTSDHFYSRLPVQEGFGEVANLSRFATIPDDWCVVIADVMNSTDAIHRGEYKAVNITGVSVITSVLNVTRPLEIPYIFGGDGATLCIPGRLAEAVRSVLIATRFMAQQQFGLKLRIGIVPVTEITKAGYKLMVVRHRVSEYFIQAAFAAGGVEYAERIIKDDGINTSFRIDESIEPQAADYSGLECRWDNVPSKHGETIALIVKAVASSIEREAEIYSEIIARIHDIYGDDELSRPVYKEGLHTTMKNRQLKFELKARTCTRGKIACFFYWLSLRLQILLGRLLMKFGITTGETDWDRYKDDLVRNTDFRKFDGILREVLSGTPEQRRALVDYLEERVKQGECVYGIHVSDAAMITCLILNRSGNHFHFIDAANGGYAMAATTMKEQFKS